MKISTFSHHLTSLSLAFLQPTNTADPIDDIGADTFIAHSHVTHRTADVTAADQSAQISVTEADAGTSDVTSTWRWQSYGALPSVDESDRQPRSTIEPGGGAAELRKREHELGHGFWHGFRLGQQRRFRGRGQFNISAAAGQRTHDATVGIAEAGNSGRGTAARRGGTPLGSQLLLQQDGTARSEFRIKAGSGNIDLWPISIFVLMIKDVNIFKTIVDIFRNLGKRYFRKGDFDFDFYINSDCI